MSDQQSVITVTEGIDHLLITDSARPNLAWRFTTYKLLKTFASDRDFFVIEALDGFTKVAMITLEIDTQHDRLAFGFSEDRHVGSYVNVAFHDVNATVMPIVVETPTDVYQALYNQSTKRLVGELPQSPLDIKVFTALLQEVEGPIKAWIGNADPSASEGYGAPPGVVFQKSPAGNKKEKCDKLGAIKTSAYGLASLASLVGAGLFVLAGDLDAAGKAAKKSSELSDKSEKADKKACKDEKKVE